jgi:ATP-dependent RNA helicase SUPV3L1/SUV3
MLPPVLRRLGFRVLPAISLPEDQFGPPGPAMVVPLRRPAAPPRDAGPRPRRDGPFAALASLRR